MKIRAMPFLAGSWGYSIFSNEFEFSICATVVLGLLVLTKQIDLF